VSHLLETLNIDKIEEGKIKPRYYQHLYQWLYFQTTHVFEKKIKNPNCVLDIEIITN
jgi:hypothetical protein